MRFIVLVISCLVFSLSVSKGQKIVADTVSDDELLKASDLKLSKKEQKNLESQLISVGETPLIFEDTAMIREQEEHREKKKKKKWKRKVIYGYKTRKAWTKRQRGSREYRELFFILKQRGNPQPWADDIFWYHVREREIKRGPIRDDDARFARLLHGPYEKYMHYKDRKTGESKKEILIKGIFFKGAKHGRWTYYDGSDRKLLKDKLKYYKGWPKESKITYYDAQKEKMKEVIPIQYGQREGSYYFWNQEGRVLVKGQYENDKRIGKWYEYHDDARNRIKRKIIYPKSGYDYDFVPYVDVEYNENGKLIHNAQVDGKTPPEDWVKEQEEKKIAEKKMEALYNK